MSATGVLSAIIRDALRVMGFVLAVIFLIVGSIFLHLPILWPIGWGFIILAGFLIVWVFLPLLQYIFGD